MAVVYFIHNEPLEAVKIGKAISLPKRLESLQCGSPAPLIVLGTVPLYPNLEAILHRYFKRLRIRGEWFRIEVEVVRRVIEVLRLSSPASVRDLAILMDPASASSLPPPARQKGRGRPPLADPRTKRNKRLDDVRFSRSEIRRAKARAKRANMRWSDWVRWRIGGADKGLYRRYQELRSQGLPTRGLEFITG